jgi:hypothetical protein
MALIRGMLNFQGNKLELSGKVGTVEPKAHYDCDEWDIETELRSLLYSLLPPHFGVTADYQRKDTYDKIVGCNQ